MKLQTKADKIKLLKDVQAGRITINEIITKSLPTKLEVWREVLPDRSQFKNNATGEVLSLEDFDNRRSKRNKDFNITYIIVKYNEIPLAFSERDVVM